MPRVDLSGYEEKDFENLPKGEYNFEIEQVHQFDIGEDGKHPGADIWSVELKVIDEGEYENRREFDNVLVPCEECEKARENNEPIPDGHDEEQYPLYTLFQILTVTNEQHSFDLSSPELDIYPDMLEGLKLRARVGKQKKTDYNEIKRYKRIGEDDNSAPDLTP